MFNHQKDKDISDLNNEEEIVLIGAGSVVAKDVPPNTVVPGNPAKIIKEIEMEDK